MRHNHSYEKLARMLKDNGYTVTVTKEEPWKYYPPYNFYSVTGNGIKAGFCTPNKSSYRSLNGRIAADNERCFDKWSKCPVVMNINGLNYEKLLISLAFLGSEEGYNLSNNFEESEYFVYEMD